MRPSRCSSWRLLGVSGPHCNQHSAEAVFPLCCREPTGRLLPAPCEQCPLQGAPRAPHAMPAPASHLCSHRAPLVTTSPLLATTRLRKPLSGPPGWQDNRDTALLQLAGDGLAHAPCLISAPPPRALWSDATQATSFRFGPSAFEPHQVTVCQDITKPQ